MTVRILLATPFAAVALILLGGFLAMVYEAWAIITQHDTLSRMTAQALQAHSTWGGFLLFLAGILFGALAVHFSGWSAT